MIARVTASSHESDEGDRVTANGHGDLPDEQGNANAPVATGSGQKTATGHSESDPDGIGSDPKTATDHVETPSASEPDGTDSGPKTATAHGKTATETSPADDTLDHLTANGKRSESESDETGHESCPTVNGLDDPSVLLELKIEKTLSTHHLAERAEMSWERISRKGQNGQQAAAVSEQPPPPQPAKEQRRQKRTHAQ